MEYLILAYYYYTELEDPKREVSVHKKFLQELDVKARIYLAKNGIKGQMSASKEAAEVYMEWLRSDPRFSGVKFKLDPYHEHVFPKLTVKYRRQLVALDVFPDLSLGGEHVAPKKWREMLESRDENTLLLDVRNGYESEIGHFEGAERPKLTTFREFPSYVQELKNKKDPKKTPVMIYCTGGIRCETYSMLLKEAGFEKVYQLDGGVINYGHKEKGKHWKGKLFVFDDRLAAPLHPEADSNPISQCKFCASPCDAYRNCANMDCNELFLTCPECADKLQGCCCGECLEEGRVRPYEPGERPKPFRKVNVFK